MFSIFKGPFGPFSFTTRKHTVYLHSITNRKIKIMSSIRYRHNRNLATLIPTGLLYESKIITGDTIPALLSNGERHFAPYRGSIDERNAGGLQRVKLVKIEMWSPDASGIGTWYDIPKNSYLVGVYLRGDYYLVLRHNRPIVHEV